MLGWHFLRDDGTRSSDSYKPAPGETEIHDEQPLICNKGLHASVRVLDALKYADGALLRRVDLGGELIPGKDKICATIRRELWRFDATQVLRDFARWVAYATVLGHWPDAPDVICQWLADGNESIVDSATKAARDARSANSANSIVDATILTIAWATAKEPAWVVARSTAMVAADVTAHAALVRTWPIVWAETHKSGAAWIDVKNAFVDMTKTTVWDAMNAHLEKMIECVHTKT